MAGNFEFANEIIPPVSIDRILLEPGSSEDKTHILIDMSIQDTLDNGDTSWFFQEDFIDYLKVKVLLSNSREETETILTQDVSQIVNMLNNNEIADDNISIKVKGKMKKDASLIDDPVLDSNGNLIYRIPIQHGLEAKLGDHFSVFVYAFVDLRDISEKFGLDIPDGAFVPYSHGEISGETVLNDNKIISSSAIFFTVNANGSQTIWTGPVRFDSAENQYYVPDTNPRRILQKTSIPNYKVQDFRSSRATVVSPPVITESMEQFKKAQDRLLNSETLNFGINTDNYCSPGAESSDKGGIITTYFDLDFQNLVQYNSLFGSLMSGPSKQDVLQNSRITELKIFRRRVKKRGTNNNLGTTIDDIYVFDQNEPWEMVAIAGEPKNDRFISESKYYAGNQPIEQNLIGSVLEVARGGQFEENTIRTFEVKDYKLREKTFGLYQYGIELKIEDGTVMFLQGILNKLSTAINVISNYYTIATSIKFYNPQTRRFNKDLIKFYEMNDEMPWVTAIETYIEALEKLAGEQDPLTLEEKSELAIELNNLANPNNGTPEGVAALITLLENFEDAILKTLQGKVRFMNQQTDGNQSEIYHKNNYERFVINYSHFLNSFVDSDFPDGTGMHVLPTESPTLYLGKFKTRAEEESLKYFKYGSPDQIQKNIGKVPGLNDENKGISDVKESFYTYFSPMSISVGGQKLELQNKGNAIWDNSSYERFTTFLLQSGNGPKLSFPEDSIAKTGNAKVSSKNRKKAPSVDNVRLLEGMLSGYSVTVSTTLEENRTTTETIKSPPPDSSMRFSDNSSTKKDNNTYDEFLVKNVSDVGRIFTSLAITNGAGKKSPIRNKNRQPETKPTIKSYNLTTNENLIDVSVRKSAIQKGQLEKVPNQISSLFLSQSPAVKNNWQNYEKQGIDFVSSNQTDLMFLYNYSALFKIQFQDGYQKSKDGKSLLNQPIWKDVTEDTLKRIEKSEILLCRVEKYSNPEIGVEFPELLDLPIFDKHFLLAKDKTTLNNAKTPMRAKKKKQPSHSRTLKKANKSSDFTISAFSKGIVREGK